MIEIEHIAEPIKQEFARFKEAFLKQLDSDTPLLHSAVNKALKSNGKFIRPLLIMLTASACGGISERTHQYALIIEMLHNATLIHDDVVDETKQRRNQPSLNAIYDNRIAVLTGDYMLACALNKAAIADDIFLIKIISQVCRELSEGELMQLDNANRQVFDEESYFNAIKKKTASLISASAEIGASTASSSAETVNLCRSFGLYLGFCFQIKDDIFDYYDNTKLGKPTGNDLKEGKITLPLLYALKKSHYNNSICRIIKEKDFSPENISALIQFAKDNEGIDYAERVLKDYKDRATELIDMLPSSPAHNSLLMLADYFACRNK